MIWITIRNHETGEIIAIDRDVRTVHPAWVHDQLGTTCESELQHAMDQCYVGAYADGMRDESGVLIQRCCDGCDKPLTATEITRNERENAAAQYDVNGYWCDACSDDED